MGYKPNKNKRSSLKNIPYLELLKDELKKCNNCGIYVFHTIKDDLLDIVFYIGYSTNLKSRVISSLCEKINLIDDEDFYISIIDSYNELDSALLEIYLINKHNPIFNKGYKFNEIKSDLISIKQFEISKTIKIDRSKWKTDLIFSQLYQQM